MTDFRKIITNLVLSTDNKKDPTPSAQFYHSVFIFMMSNQKRKI